MLEQIVLARDDRAIYYVEFLNNIIHFTKIHGKSPLDILENGNHFQFSFIENSFDLSSKYGEVVGQKYYKQINTNMI